LDKQLQALQLQWPELFKVFEMASLFKEPLQELLSQPGVEAWRKGKV
jgi:hypothetical protein